MTVVIATIEAESSWDSQNGLEIITRGVFVVADHESVVKILEFKMTVPISRL